MHPLQARAVQNEIDASSGSAIDESRLDLALDWITAAEHLMPACRNMQAQAHDQIQQQYDAAQRGEEQGSGVIHVFETSSGGATGNEGCGDGRVVPWRRI